MPSRTEFEGLYEQFSREVWAVVFGRRMDSELAMDITQETFLRLWRELEAGTKIDNPRAWLIRVARNLAEDWAKSAFRRFGTQPQYQMNEVLSKESPLLDRMEQDEKFGQIREVLEELNASDREILTLKYSLDYDTRTIAALLAVSETAVHMRLSRARQRLAERLITHGVHPSS